jgi:hypothetical protein
VIGLYAFLALFVGIPMLVYLADWRRRRRRTRDEIDAEAVRVAREGSDGPGDHEPMAPGLPNIPLGGPPGL